MTTEEQKLALLEWAGWTYIKGVSEYDGMEMPYTIWKHGGKKYNSKDIPNLSSLDVIAEFEGGLRDNPFHYANYFGNLFKVVAGRNGEFLGYFNFNMITATAPQRLEALVRTLGLWKE